jgi:AcrR family transcriptional regulator
MDQMVDDAVRVAPRRSELTVRQEEILDQLEGIVVRSGFRHLTLLDLTSELRCSRTILYALAPTKEELALLVIDRFLGRLGSEMGRAVARAKGPRDQMAAALDTLASLIGPVSRRFFEDIELYGPARALHLRHTNAAAARLRAIISAGTEQGAFNAVDALFAAEVISLVLSGISDGSLLDRTGLTSAEAVGQLKHMAFDGLIPNVHPAKHECAAEKPLRQASKARMRTQGS